MTARPRGAEAEAVRLFAHWDPDEGAAQALRLHVEVLDARLAAWQGWLPEELPLTAGEGRGDMALWLDLDQGRLSALSGELDLQGLTLRRGERQTTLAGLRGRFDWRQQTDGWLLRAYGDTDPDDSTRPCSTAEGCATALQLHQD